MPNSLDLPHAPKDTRIVVAMSGGVDSSVVAALLKSEGYDVVGITLQLYSSGEGPRRAGACCAGQDIHDARRVAEALEIPHYVLDYEEIFRRSVIDPFAESYIAGETPIPCVSCNQTVKFRDLLATARDLGAEALATGHYIDSRRGRGTGDGAAAHRALHRPADLDRDQSYFLYATTQAQIDFLRCPGCRACRRREARAARRCRGFRAWSGARAEGAETRDIAARHGLLVADKPDSQDICFVAKGRYSDIIARLKPGAGTPGDIVHVDGRHLGRHAGIVNFTVGQRRGIGISSPEPLYVVALDAPTGRVLVGPREALATRRLVLRAVNWLGDGPLETAASEGMEMFVRVRSTRPPAPARLSREGAEIAVELSLGEDGVAPGQACVFYAGEGAGARVLGGGIIARTLSVSALARFPEMAAGTARA